MGKKVDLTGQRFGRLVVSGRHTPTTQGGKKKRLWLCACDCGGKTIISTERLLSQKPKNKTRSCGCLNPKAPLNLDGRRFGLLTVISKSKVHKTHGAYWTCACDCGKSKEILGTALHRGVTMSCGCMIGKHRNRPARIYMSGKEQTKAYNHRKAVQLRDVYIKNQISSTYQIKNPTPELIQLKREQIQLHRELKKGKEKLNGTS